MFAQLAITDSSTGQSSGTVQVLFQTYGDVVEQNWEWLGGPDASDGGTWVWRLAVVGGVRTPYMELTSNISGGVIGEIGCDAWIGAAVPPAQPWFPSGTHQDAGLLYYTASGLKYPYDWDVS
jgi:hypothetical protein